MRNEYETALASPGESDSFRQPKSKAVDEQPRTRQKQQVGDLHGRFGYYNDINEVDDKVISEAIKFVLQTYGATQKDELLKCVSQTLGFSRLGPRIRSAIEDSLVHSKSSGGVATRDDDLYSLPTEN